MNATGSERRENEDVAMRTSGGRQYRGDATESVGNGDRRIDAVGEGDGERRVDGLEPLFVMTVVTDHHLGTDEPRVTEFVETAIRCRP